jgi:hypothetical protein
MDALEILRLYAEGHRLVCRYCKVEFETIPKSLALGERPMHIVCPKNPNHMTILAEPEAPMKAMRELMADMRRKNETG